MAGIPVNVFTGFLGSGKTTILKSILDKLPKSYNIVILKNEFGDSKTDSELFRNFNVAEMVNGCLCCVLVGQMKNALLEIKEKYNPDRILIETSGSAFPAPISIQIRELSPAFTLDSIITVIDCINFVGYEDKSYTAKARYTDLILMNKHELVSDDHYDRCLDHVFDLNEDTPKIKFHALTGIPSQLIFGIDTKLFSDDFTHSVVDRHHYREVGLIQINIARADCNDADACCDHKHLHSQAVMKEYNPLLHDNILSVLGKFGSSDEIYRIKGFVRTLDSNNESKMYILNWAFGRFTMEPSDSNEEWNVRITVMGDLNNSHVALFTRIFGASEDQITFQNEQSISNLVSQIME